jgi:hypothetical protein
MVFIISSGERLRAGGGHRRGKDEHFHVHEFLFRFSLETSVPMFRLYIVPWNLASKKI